MLTHVINDAAGAGALPLRVAEKAKALAEARATEAARLAGTRLALERRAVELSIAMDHVLIIVNYSNVYQVIAFVRTIMFNLFSLILY